MDANVSIKKLIKTEEKGVLEDYFEKPLAKNDLEKIERLAKGYVLGLSTGPC